MISTRIIREVAEAHGLTPSDIIGRERTRPYSRARHEAMWRLYQVRLVDGRRRYSFPMLGRIFGRDHTVCLHGVRRHEARMGVEA